MALNYDTTWLGLLGGGVSGSIVGGGSIYQVDVWNMGGNPLPARVLVKGKRLGAVAETGASHAMLIVTGCKHAQEMEGIESSGLDWEFAVGVKGSALVKTGAKLFKTMAAEVAASVGLCWATNESAKRLVQWTMDDLGIVKPGRQFNLLPSPLSFGVGGGIFYEWQKLHLLSGKIGWNYISPDWYIEKVGSAVRLQMSNIPEQDGGKVKIGFSVPEWGLDPYIRWKKDKGTVDIKDYHITGYVYGGLLFERPNRRGTSGINLSNLQPTGRLEQGWISPTLTTEVKRAGTLKVRPTVFQFANLPFWKARDTATMVLNTDGRFLEAKNGRTVRS
jgi:hypothetical protein